MSRALRPAVVAAALGLLLLWAFVSYLEPGFTGEVVGALLRCN